MRHTGFAIGGWVVAAIVIALGGVRWAASQPGLPEGAFVTAQDGTRWAVGGGARVRLTFATDDANVIAGLRDAGTAATLGEAAAALAGAAPPPPMTEPANPAETLLGQSVVGCAETGFPFEFEVTRAGWQRTVLDRTATGNAMWVVLVVNVTNLTTIDLAPYRGGTPSLRLTDERGRRFDGDLFAHFDLHVELAGAYGFSAPFFNSIRPGITEERVIAFEVARDVQRLTLASAVGC